ncbi:MAG: fumarylacetoacetate hydrolase family protein [Pseudomonadota bacterium]
MRTDFIHRIARDRFNGWRQRERFTQLIGDNAPRSMDEAYAIQSALYEIMRQEAGFSDFDGHKVALTSPDIQKMCGVDQPAYGAVFREFVHHTGHKIKTSDFIRLGIEFEVALEIGEDVPTGEYTKETISNYISAVMPAFELIDDRDADYAHLDAMSILCDRCWCNGIVLGKRIENWRNIDLGNAKTRILWNGVEDETGNTGAALGHPLNSAAFVANHLAKSSQSLKAGEVIMTGSALKTRFPNSGDTVTYRIDGLGDVSAHVS